MHRRDFFSVVLGACIALFVPKKVKAIDDNKPQVEIKKRKGFKFIEGTEKMAPIVAMIEFKGGIWIATTKRVYEIKDNKANQAIAKPVKFIYQ